MGKNQAYKAMQRAKMASAGGPDEIEDGMEAERKKGELEADEARLMREYRAQLDAERASKLARGRNHADKRLSSEKGKKDKDKDGRNSKRKKRSRKRHRDSSSDSDLDSSGSDDERHTSRKERSKLKRYRKERKRKSRQKQSRSSSDDSSGDSKEYGPVPLSSFFDKKKD